MGYSTLELFKFLLTSHISRRLGFTVARTPPGQWINDSRFKAQYSIVAYKIGNECHYLRNEPLMSAAL